MEFLVRFLHQTTTCDWIVWEPWWLYIVRFLHQTTTMESSTMASMVLYIVRFLHQTTTIRIWGKICLKLYIVRFLHQTTTFVRLMPMPYPLYIVRFLHQTTTLCTAWKRSLCCISSVSYIKPQPCRFTPSSGACCISSVSYIKPQLMGRGRPCRWVVYRPFPTSNHNMCRKPLIINKLYIVRFLHQTTTNL